MRKLIVVALLTLVLSGFTKAARAEVAFSPDQVEAINSAVLEFGTAMGAVSIDPQNNCPRILSVLPSKFEALQPLIAIAAQQAGAQDLAQSSPARLALDVSSALKFVEDACSKVV